MSQGCKHIEADSFGSMRPENLRNMCKHSLSIKDELPLFKISRKPQMAFLCMQYLMFEWTPRFNTTSSRVPEVMHRKIKQTRKKENFCFHKRDQACLDTLTLLHQLLDNTVKEERRRGKNALLLSNMPSKQYNYYNTQNEYYQIMDDKYKWLLKINPLSA